MAKEEPSISMLIADDEESICFSLAFMLRRRGIVPCVVSNGEAAVAAFQGHDGEFAAVFLDVRMPGLAGPQALTAMRESRPDIPCCLMTAFSRSAISGCAEPDEILLKPFDVQDFLKTLDRLLARRLERLPKTIRPASPSGIIAAAMTPVMVAAS